MHILGKVVISKEHKLFRQLNYESLNFYVSERRYSLFKIKLGFINLNFFINSVILICTSQAQ